MSGLPSPLSVCVSLYRRETTNMAQLGPSLSSDSSKQTYWTIQSILKLYQNLIKSNPIMTKSITSGMIALIGSSISQVCPTWKVRLYFPHLGRRRPRSFLKSLSVLPHIRNISDRSQLNLSSCYHQLTSRSDHALLLQSAGQDIPW